MSSKEIGAEFEPRWFIWTITLLIVVGVSLSGYIIVSAEKDSAEAYQNIVIPTVKK